MIPALKSRVDCHQYQERRRLFPTRKLATNQSINSTIPIWKDETSHNFTTGMKHVTIIHIAGTSICDSAMTKYRYILNISTSISTSTALALSNTWERMQTAYKRSTFNKSEPQTKMNIEACRPRGHRRDAPSKFHECTYSLDSILWRAYSYPHMPFKSSFYYHHYSFDLYR